MALSARDVADRLETIEPLELPAAELVYHVATAEMPDAPELVDSQEDLWAAVDELRGHADATRKVVRRCCDLSPVPSRRVPTGF